MMTHICAGKILVQENIPPVDGYVHLVHIFKQKADMAWHLTCNYLRNYGIHLYIRASVGVSYFATQFHVRNTDGRMSKGVLTSQRCEWLIVTSSNVSSKINVNTSKIQIPISLLII